MNHSLMDANGSRGSICNEDQMISSDQEDQLSDLKRGPWTVEEDLTLMNYIHNHGEGRWNSLARLAGLKRTGKSCRLRWLNYLRPDIRRGNITLQEQLMILELHSRWGNRWSKIAQYLPGRTDNEIKNYWRTRVQKHAKQLKCDVNSQQFKDTMRYLWMPRLVERIQAAADYTSAANTTVDGTGVSPANSQAMGAATSATYGNYNQSFNNNVGSSHIAPCYTPENSSTAASSSESFAAQVSPISDFADQYNNIPVLENPNLDYYNFYQGHDQVRYGDASLTTSSSGYNYFEYGSDFPAMDQNRNLSWLDGGETLDSLWDVDNIWFLQNQQLNSNI